ncbi:MAG TPA: DUF4238 domain-containing protein [Sphingobium sp.]|nr:DUF4238 domain-containing protein [Sphingobium sp.]
MAAGPKRHHYIPQMMLRHFVDEHGQLWFWRRTFEPGEVKTVSTQNIFVEKDLYTRVGADGSKDLSLETFFSDLEGTGAAFIRQLCEIVRNNELPKLDDGAWDFWDHFFYYLQKRTPGAIAAIAEQMGFGKKIEATAAEVRAARAERGDDSDQPDLEQWIAKNAIVVAQARAPGPELLATLKTLGLAIYRIKDPMKSFIVSDVPGATAKFPTGNGWSHPTLFIPLTADIAVGHLAGGRRTEVITVDRDQVRRMNVASAARSTVLAGRSKALLASLSRDVPYVGVTPLDFI